MFALWHFDTHPAPAAAAPKPKSMPARTRARGPKPLQLLSTPRPPLRGKPRVAARSAILVDRDTGAVLWTKLPRRRRPIASTTKIMTATLVLDRLPLHRVVRVPPAATRTPLVREGLRRNERVAAWKRFAGLLIFSGTADAPPSPA